MATLGSTAWIVGERIASSDPPDREGVVYSSVDSGGGFQALVDAGLVVPLCIPDGTLLLSAVGVAPNGDVFVGGACGRLYRRLASTSTWDEIEVPSTSDILSISIVPSGGGYSVFLGCHSPGEPTQAILKY